jgi:8-amino-7-oxononanoate synthase
MAAQKLSNACWTNSSSPIQCLIITGNEVCRRMAATAQAAGYDVRAILSPTVPVGQERIRICLHSFNTEDEIAGLMDALAS